MDAASLCARCRSFQIRYSKRLHLQCLLYVMFFKNANVFFLKSRKNNFIFQKIMWRLLHIPPSARYARRFPCKQRKRIYRPSPLSRGAVNVSQSHIAVARVLGTFSHTTCYPISFVLWTCFLDRSARGTAQAVEGAQRRGCCTKMQQPLFDVILGITDKMRSARLA